MLEPRAPRLAIQLEQALEVLVVSLSRRGSLLGQTGAQSVQEGELWVSGWLSGSGGDGAVTFGTAVCLEGVCLSAAFDACIALGYFGRYCFFTLSDYF